MDTNTTTRSIIKTVYNSYKLDSQQCGKWLNFKNDATNKLLHVLDSTQELNFGKMGIAFSNAQELIQGVDRAEYDRFSSFIKECLVKENCQEVQSLLTYLGYLQC